MEAYNKIFVRRESIMRDISRNDYFISGGVENVLRSSTLFTTANYVIV